MSGLDNKKNYFSTTSQAEIKDLKIEPSLALRINPRFIQYVTDKIIVFVSGCNVILYNFETKVQKFLLKKSNQRSITYLSVGQGKMSSSSSMQEKKSNNFMRSMKSKKGGGGVNDFHDTEYESEDRELEDKIICIGEYDNVEEVFYLTSIRPTWTNFNILNGENITQTSIKSTAKNWKINFCTILNNTSYCISISQKKVNSIKKPINSRISFGKHTSGTFISQENVEEELIYCCYNPKNTIELVLCGKGYLRLWNVFVNEGTLKEHQQRFLRGKQEKEQTFIKAQFFDKKPFLLIVGTLENTFYIIDSFQVIHELNVCYAYENIYDLNIQNLHYQRENDDIGNLKENIDSITRDDIDSKLKQISALTNSPLRKKQLISNEEEKEKNKEDSNQSKDNSNSNNNINTNGNSQEVGNKSTVLNNTNSNNSNTNINGVNGNSNKSDIINNNNKSKEEEKNDVFKRLYKSRNFEENDGKINKSNRVKFFELINDNLLMVIYAYDGCCLMYNIDWNKKIQDDKSLEENKKWKAADCNIIRIAKNVQTIYAYSIEKNDIILVVESKDKINGGSGYIDLDNKNRSNISLYKMKKILVNEKKKQPMNMLSYESELFNGYFESNAIKFIDFCEKKQFVYYLDEKNILNCFDLLKSKYVIKFPFGEKVYSMSVNSSKNILAVGFKSHVTIYGKLKDLIQKMATLQVEEGLVKFSSKGDILVISAINRNPKMEGSFCLYFIDTESFNTIYVFENLANRMVKLNFIDNDEYLFCLSNKSYIMGIYLNIYNCNNIIHEIYDQDINKKAILTQRHFQLIFTHNPHGKNYSSFDYDSDLQIAVALEKESNHLFVLSSSLGSGSKKDKNNGNGNNGQDNGNSGPICTEYQCNLRVVKIVKELRILMGGDTNGNLNIYDWPLRGYTTNEIVRNINENIITSINLDLGYIDTLLNFKNFTTFITMTSDSHIFINNILLSGDKYNYQTFEYFDKHNKPQMEIYIPPYDMYDVKLEDITKKETNVEILDAAMIKLKEVMEEDKDEIKKNNNLELENMINNLVQNTESENAKFESLDRELKNLIHDMEMDKEKRIEEMENNKNATKEKYENKLLLYDQEIERLKNEYQGIKDAIEDKYKTEAEEQREFYEQKLESYNEKFNKLKNDTHKSLVKYVNLTSEYDDAADKIEEDYKNLITDLKKKIETTKERNINELKEEEAKLKEAKITEDKHKIQLEEKVKESDKLIEKNVEIKQNIISATQRTITFQEQLLETEKNLVKIDKKLEDLIVKNKHLEQIRFVLEHRMTSLEKEKSPLEGQCAFLENQKNKLTEEFNKIILQINKNNQELENKQSQLRASLIQNYEIHDQKNYVEAKLIQLKSDIEQFLMNYQDLDEEKLIRENKATYVALNFKKFYDKYFSTSIDDELKRYHYYSQKLQEQTDKDGIANNFDLIMRNKAEEKLICEKAKVDELMELKERGFKRIQSENTMLITECNRLRKNLHEIYMHVIDIEQRFENLTKINPKLSKSEIVAQIKEFIRITHEKIKANYSKSKNGKNSGSYRKLSRSIVNSDGGNKLNKIKEGKKIEINAEINNCVSEGGINDNKLYASANDIENGKLSSGFDRTNERGVANTEVNNAYANVIKFPEIKSSKNFRISDDSKRNETEIGGGNKNSEALPLI